MSARHAAPAGGGGPAGQAPDPLAGLIPAIAPPGSPAAGLRRETIGLGLAFACISGTGTPLAWARHFDDQAPWCSGCTPVTCTEPCKDTPGGTPGEPPAAIRQGQVARLREARKALDDGTGTPAAVLDLVLESTGHEIREAYGQAWPAPSPREEKSL